MRLFSLLPLLAACSGVEPLELPDPLSEQGAPVGVRTVVWGDLSMEIWYPASDRADEPAEQVDFASFLTDEFFDRLGEDVTIPIVPTTAMRDVPVRRGEQPWPVLLFSHGLAGNRNQSTDLTIHLASRGYVVVAPDHWGRHTAEILPCIWDPALDDCDLSGFTGNDPAPGQLADALAWLDRAAERREDPLYERIDMESLGLFGHSAGGASTADFGNVEDRFDALLPMAGSGVVDRDVPTLNMVGVCDGVVTSADIQEGHDASTDATWLGLEAAGHHAFSDICLLGLAAIARDDLSGRDDVNDTLLNAMITLVADGCPEEVPTPEECTEDFMSLERGFEISRHYATAWFDLHLKGGPELLAGAFEDATLE